VYFIQNLQVAYDVDVAALRLTLNSEIGMFRQPIFFSWHLPPLPGDGNRRRLWTVL